MAADIDHPSFITTCDTPNGVMYAVSLPQENMVYIYDGKFELINIVGNGLGYEAGELNFPQVRLMGDRFNSCQFIPPNLCHIFIFFEKSKVLNSYWWNVYHVPGLCS